MTYGDEFAIIQDVLEIVFIRRGGFLRNRILKHRMLILVTMIFVFAFSSLACASVQMGMKGSVVQSVQYMLQDAGYLSGSADGDFGSQTQQAVVQFQTDHGLSGTVRQPAASENQNHHLHYRTNSPHLEAYIEHSVRQSLSFPFVHLHKPKTKMQIQRSLSLISTYDVSKYDFAKNHLFE